MLVKYCEANTHLILEADKLDASKLVHATDTYVSMLMAYKFPVLGFDQKGQMKLRHE